LPRCAPIHPAGRVPPRADSFAVSS
jgi:hypothetical protein